MKGYTKSQCETTLSLRALENMQYAENKEKKTPDFTHCLAGSLIQFPIGLIRKVFGQGLGSAKTNCAGLHTLHVVAIPRRGRDAIRCHNWG